jgi:hypothetical protein
MGGNYFAEGPRWWYAATLWRAAEASPVEEMPVDGLIDAELRRFLDADIYCPVTLMPSGHLCDGYHRVVKAVMTGQKTIKVKRIVTLPEPDGFTGSGGPDE